MNPPPPDGRWEDRIHAKVLELARVNGIPVRELRMDDVLLRKGILDSPAVLELIVWLESEFEVDLDQDDLSLDNFGTINQIARFLQEKRTSA